FAQVGGQSRNGLGGGDATTGAVKPWSPDVNRVCCQAVAGSLAIAIADGAVFAGGLYSSVGGVARTNLAALDLATGHPTSWAPQSDQSVNDMVTDGTWLYLGGYFHNVNGTPQSYLGRVSVASGALDATWAPTPSDVVTKLALTGNALYVGGYFESMNLQPHHMLAAVDASNASVLPWSPVISIKPVYQIVPDAANNAVSAVSPAGLWRFRASDGVTLWNATIDYSPSLGLAAYTAAQVGGAVYLGGSLQHVNGVARNHLAALDAASGALLPWAPEADRVVTSLD